MTPPEPCSGSTITAASSCACSRDQPRGALGVVVLRDDERERRVDRRAGRGLEEEDAAVVAALEDHDRGLPGRDARERDREQVRLGARVAEPHELDRREALADRRREALPRSGSARRTRCRRRARRESPRGSPGASGRTSPAVYSPRKSTYSWPSASVEARALAAHDRERERLDVDDRPRVAAGHHLARAPRAAGATPGCARRSAAAPRAARGRRRGHGHG